MPNQHRLHLTRLNPEPPHIHLRERGSVLGHARLILPNLDNPTNALAELTVRPDARRRGAGRLLWDHIADLARADGRKLIFFEAREDSAGEKFAHAIDAELGIFSARRRLVVDDAVRATAVALAESARTAGAGYHVHTFVGAVPDQFVDGTAYLNGRMSIDAPLENLELEPEIYDAARLRGREAAADEQGLVVYTAIAVESATGFVAAWTNIGVTPEDLTHGWQWNTIVDPDHRGHRLGTWVKVANLLALLDAQPELRTVLTWNAVSNDPMITVNEAMGFRLWDHWGEWQARL